MCMYIGAHGHTKTCAHAGTHVYTCARARVCAYTQEHTDTQTHVPTQAHTRVHMCTSTRVCARDKHTCAPGLCTHRDSQRRVVVQAAFLGGPSGQPGCAVSPRDVESRRGGSGNWAPFLQFAFGQPGLRAGRQGPMAGLQGGSGWWPHPHPLTQPQLSPVRFAVSLPPSTSLPPGQAGGKGQ